jgi:hypothetical protein
MPGHKDSIPYRDIMVSPNSDLYQAIQDGDQKKAKEIYDRCRAVQRREQGLDETK